MEVRSNADVQIACQIWVIGAKASSTHLLPVHSEVSLRIADTQQIPESCAIKQMIRGIGVLKMSTYSQTLNVHNARLASVKPGCGIWGCQVGLFR